jgi:hypothetical protein
MRKPFRVLVAAIVILLTGEWLVRLFVAGPSAQVFDPDIGYSYRPNVTLFQAKEGHARLRLNALGLNDEEIGPKNGRCRVLVVGDSYTAALQVARDENFTSIAEQLNHRLDVVNAGRDGLFLGDLHKVAGRLAAPLEADLVVYVLSQRAVDTDIDLPDFSVVVDPATGAITDAVMRVEGKEQLKQRFEPILRESALATRLAGQLRPSVEDARRQLAVWRRTLDPSSAPIDVAASRPTDVDVLRFVFRRFAAQGPRAAILYVNGLLYQANHIAVVSPTSSAAEAVARRAADLEGVRFQNTGKALIASVARTGNPPYGFENSLLPGGHLNAEGHRAIGRVLADLVHAMTPPLPAACAGR